MEEGSLGSLPRSRVSVKFFVNNYFRLYEKRASPPWRDLAIGYPRSRLGGLEIFHINALNTTHSYTLLYTPIHSYTLLHTTEFVLASIFLDDFSFYKFCLFMCRL